MRRPRLFTKCPTCGRRPFRACGARARGREGNRRSGFYAWRKWNPCSEFAPGGLIPGIDRLPADGGLDDLSDIVPESHDESIMAAIAQSGGLYAPDGCAYCLPIRAEERPYGVKLAECGSCGWSRCGRAVNVGGTNG